MVVPDVQPIKDLVDGRIFGLAHLPNITVRLILNEQFILSFTSSNVLTTKFSIHLTLIQANF